MAAKPRSVVIIGVVSLAFAAIASYSLFNYLQGQELRAKSAVATAKVVVAAQKISPGSAINVTQVKAINWPQSDIPQGAFASTDQVVSRLSMDGAAPGEPILESKLVPKEGQTGVLTYKIPEGHRAMTVGVDPVSGVAGFIMPGNKVDVVLTTNQGFANNQPPVSKIVLQNVPVLAIGQIVEQQKEGKPLVVPTVTMDVVPNDAEKLAIASTQGKLQLVLRRAGDTDVAKTSGETVIKVINSSGFSAGSAAASRAVSAKKTRPKEVAETKQMVRTEKPVDLTSVDVWRSSRKTTETFRPLEQ